MAVPSGEPNGPVKNLPALCRAGGFRVIEREMEAADGGPEAVLLPRPGNRFHVWVDPTPPLGWDRIAPGIRQTVRRQRLRFRVAHEIAHSLFYRRGRGVVPERLLGDGEQQEKFADGFARALLVPTELAREASCTPMGVLEIHRRCDVSLEVALRAFSAVERRRSSLLGHWPTDADPMADDPRVQWASGDIVRQGHEALLRRIRTIAEVARGNRRTDLSGQLFADGSVLMLGDRRQVLWVDDAAPVAGQP